MFQSNHCSVPQASCGQCPIGDTTRRRGFQSRSFPSRLNRRFIRSVFMNMKNKLGVGWLALAAVLVLADRSRGEDVKLDLPAMGGAAVSPDGATLVVSLTAKAELVYIDTVTGKEGKRVSLEFQPTQLAWGDKVLFAGQKGSGVVHV